MSDDSPTLPVYRVDEVQNYGGFFGGDTVALTASPVFDPSVHLDLIIADNVWDNLTQRHKVEAGMLIGLDVDSGEVRRARVVGAPDRQQLREAIARVPPQTGALRTLAYRCQHCDQWIAGTPRQTEDGKYACLVCGERLG
jgi:hypothetical protein